MLEAEYWPDRRRGAQTATEHASTLGYNDPAYLIPAYLIEDV
ncbi:MAG TPA: hypothetical protein VHO91_10595 [Rhodopila sp.]|nr:hypothetical protein [Rhodopila sp.]